MDTRGSVAHSLDASYHGDPRGYGVGLVSREVSDDGGGLVAYSSQKSPNSSDVLH